MVAVDEAQAPARAQLPDVARHTGIPERTLQHWFREYGSYRSRRGYPLQLIADVLRDHEWEGDLAALLRRMAEGGAPADAIVRAEAPADAALPAAEERLALLVQQYERLIDEVAAYRLQSAERDRLLVREVQHLRSRSTQVATLNELRGLREEVLVLRANQRKAEEEQQALRRTIDGLHAALAERRRPWWRRR